MNIDSSLKNNFRNINSVGKSCYGCSACYSVCPTHSISMKESEEGFIYPHIEVTTCINCGKCLKICPAIDKFKISADKRIYAGIHKNPNIWANSTSGGAFNAICELYGDDDTFIVGAVFNSERKAIEHCIVKGASKASVFSGSKYVQSNLGDIFITVKKLLKDGEKVVFSGTPCQVAGLSNILEDIDATNLLSVCLFCNGVGSPKVFRDYLEALEIKNGSKIVDYKFRDKKIRFGVHHLYRMSALFENGLQISSAHDIYNECFVQQVICRSSCFRCNFNQNTIKGDISIGDFKKQYLTVEKAPYNKNGSIVISHTAKGHSICRQLDKVMMLFSVDESAFVYPSHGNYNEERRDAFFNSYVNEKQDINRVLNNYVIKPKFIYKVWGCIPDKIRGRIKSILKRG